MECRDGRPTLPDGRPLLWRAGGGDPRRRDRDGLPWPILVLGIRDAPWTARVRACWSRSRFVRVGCSWQLGLLAFNFNTEDERALLMIPLAWPGSCRTVLAVRGTPPTVAWIVLRAALRAARQQHLTWGALDGSRTPARTPIEALTDCPSARRPRQVEGLSRRTLSGGRRERGSGSFYWRPWRHNRLRLVAVSRLGGKIRVGTFAELVTMNPGIPIRDGSRSTSAKHAPSSSSSIHLVAAGSRARTCRDGASLNSVPCPRSARISVAGRTRAWRTSGSTARVTIAL